MKLKTLVAVTNDSWREAFKDAFTELGCETDATADGKYAMNSVRKIMYDIILADQSLDDSIQQMEFVLNVKDLLDEIPVVVVTGENMEKYQKLWGHCEVSFTETRSSAMINIKKIVKTAQARKKNM